MNFYFCEKCGKRVTEADLQSGAAKDKKLKGVYCTECAVGVMTMELQPLSDEDARRILSPHTPPSQASSHESSHGKLPKRSGPPSDAHLRAALRSGTPPAGTPDRANSVPRTVLWVAAPAALLSVLLGAWLFSARREDKKAEPTPAPAPKLPAPGLAQTQPPSGEAPASPPAPPALREPAETVPAPSDTPPPPVLAEDLSPERRAQNAFDDLIEFEGLAAEDKQGRTERIQAFLEKHGETIVSARARVLLQEMLAPALVSNPLARLEKPVAHWTLDDGSGTAAADASGNGHTGSLQGGATWTPAGRVGGALSFDGASGTFKVASLKGLAEGNTPHALAGWVKVTSLPAIRAWILCLGNKEAGSHHWLVGQDGETQLGVWGGMQVHPVLPAGQWKHLATTFDGTTLKGYVDGVLIGSGAANFNLQGIPFATAKQRVGENHFHGALDDLRIYDRALSDAEVAALAGAGGAGAPDPAAPPALAERPVAYWSLDDGKGTTALDASGGGHHGTLANAPAWVEGKIGRALQFNGKDNYFVADGIEVDTTAGGKNTVAFWMNWGGGDNQLPFAWQANYMLWFSKDYFGVNTGNDGLLGLSSKDLAGRWTHVAVVFPNGVPGPSNAKIYLNGVSQTLSQRPGPNPQSRTASAQVMLSGWPRGPKYKFLGALDEVRIYRRELTAEEIKALAAAGNPGGPGPAVPPALSQRPVAYWSLDDGKETTALDSAEGKHHGNLVNAPAWVEGKIGRALQFNGKDNGVVADGVDVDLKDGGKNSVAFWMKWGGGNDQMPFAWGNSYHLYFNDGSFGLNTGERGNILGVASTGLANKWVHVAVVFSNGVPRPKNTKIYIDGAPQAVSQRIGTTTKNVSATPKVFLSGGGTSPKYKFGGALDEVRIYRGELTAEEIKILAGAGGAGAPVPAGPAEVRLPGTTPIK